MKKRDKAPVLADQQTDKRLPDQQTKRLPDQQTAQRLPDQQTDEVAPLLPEQTPHVKGTSSSKAFVGTEVLFPPSGFANGGVLFISCLLVALGTF